MTTTAWCSPCEDATEHQPHETIPLGMTCTRCGHVRIDRKAYRGNSADVYGPENTRPTATSQPKLAHNAWCTGAVLRQSDLIFERHLVRWRCLGCGSELKVPRDTGGQR